jgi:hypothetical protein
MADILIFRGASAVGFDGTESGGAVDAPFPLSHNMPRAA